MEAVGEAATADGAVAAVREEGEVRGEAERTAEVTAAKRGALLGEARGAEAEQMGVGL